MKDFAEMVASLKAKPQRYRKKPVEVEAIQWQGGNVHAQVVVDWVTSNGGNAHYPATDKCGLMTGDPAAGGQIGIYTLKGPMAASPGDYVIKEATGEFYPYKPDVFAQIYE